MIFVQILTNFCVDTDVPDPYLTMALLVEEKGDIGRAAELNYMACQLKRSDMQLWQRTANMLFQVNEFEKEVDCYQHILRIDPSNQQALWDRHIALRNLRRFMDAAHDLRKLYELRPKDIYVARPLADLYWRLNMWDAIYHLLRDLLVPDEDYDLIDMFVQSLVMQKRFDDALSAISRYVKDVRAPGVPMGIRFTVGELAASSGKWSDAENYWIEIRNAGMDEVPDMFFRLAKVYRTYGKLEEAADLLQHLSKHADFANDPDVYFLRGECLLLMDPNANRDAAIDMMERVLELNPAKQGLRDHIEVLIRYESSERARILRRRIDDFEMEEARRLDREREAERGLFYGGEGFEVEEGEEGAPDPDTFPPLEPPYDTCKAVVERAIRLYEAYHYRAVLTFIAPYLDKDVSRRPLDSNRRGGKRLTKKEKRALQLEREELERLNPESWREVDRRAPRDRDYYSDEDDEPAPRVKGKGEICIIEEVGHNRYWEMMWRVIRCLVRSQDYAAASRYISELLRMEWLSVKQGTSVCQFAIALGWPFYESDYKLAYIKIRGVLLKHPDDRFVWSAFSRIMAGNFRLIRSLHKFLLRLTKKTKNPLLQLLMGHLYTSSTSISHAVKEYHKAFITYDQRGQEEVLAYFSFAVSYLNLARHRNIDDRHACVLRALGLAFRASKMMDPSSFGLFNLGRCFHHLGIFDCATKFYELCLAKRKEEIKLEVELDAGAKECRSIEREAAYNLSIMYRDAGNKSAALRVMREYLRL